MTSRLAGEGAVELSGRHDMLERIAGLLADAPTLDFFASRCSCASHAVHAMSGRRRPSLALNVTGLRMQVHAA